MIEVIMLVCSIFGTCTQKTTIIKEATIQGLYKRQEKKAYLADDLYLLAPTMWKKCEKDKI